jgi:hypothetical protein
MSTNEDMAREDGTMLRLRYWVDLTMSRLRHRVTSREEGTLLVDEVRSQILQMCPDKAHVFDLVLYPRFQRVLDEREMSGWAATGT